MAEVVLGIGTPHTPMHPKLVAQEGPTSETGALYRRVAAEIEEVAPDLIVFFDTDHFINFFFDNLPTFCIGMVDAAEGPKESRVEMPRYTVPIHEQFGRALFDYALRREFDVSSKEEMVLDHSILVPLHFLTPKMHIPIVPVYIRGLASPLPLARRCLALGRMVREFIETQWQGDERIAVQASGSFSLEVGGPRIGRTDHEWMDTVVGLLRDGRLDELVGLATTERMQRAGNVGGELLDWIAMAAAAGEGKPKFILPQEGHAFAVWRKE